MQRTFDRRSFLVQQPALFVGLAGASGWAGAQQEATPAAPGPHGGTQWPGFQQQDPALVREIVGASHGNLERVDVLVTAHPALANAAYDWGFGDWETALGAASHVGNHEIAALLLAHGARLDVFAAAMLGMKDVLVAILAARPELAATRGPHGIPLLAHAAAGGDEATIEFLKSFEGAADAAVPQLDDAAMEPYLGTYTSDVGDIIVSRAHSGMMLQSRDKGAVRLMRTGEHTFHPAGVPNVRVTFSVQASTASRLEIAEADWHVSAVRGG